MKFKEYIDMLINEGYKKGALLNQIRELCGLKTTRAVEYWLTGNSTPDVYKAQIIASYLTNKLNRKITISDLWPVQDLKADHSPQSSSAESILSQNQDS